MGIATFASAGTKNLDCALPTKTRPRGHGRLRGILV
jgi:hypothetical protein